MDNTRVRILHLDDNPADAQLIKMMVEEANHGLSASVESVSTKETYLTALRSSAFDVILSDYRMPGYDGDDALRDARATCPEIPFIMVTGEMGEERAVETLKAGATDYVLKDRILRLVPSIERGLKDAALEKERRENEKLLAKTHQELDAIVYGMVEGLIVVDMQGKILRTNPQAMAIFDCSDGPIDADALPSIADDFKVLSPDDAPMSVDQWPIGRVLRGELVKDFLTTICRRDSGMKKTLSINGSLIRDDRGNPLYGVLTFRDVTEQVQMLEALRVSEERYRQIVETAQEGIWIVDADRNTLFVNEQMAAMLGYTVQEMMGKSWTEFAAHQEQRQGSDHPALEREGGTRRSPESSEMEFKRKDGSPLWAIVNSTSLFNGKGEYSGSINMLTEIIERKRTKEGEESRTGN